VDVEARRRLQQRRRRRGRRHTGNRGAVNYEFRPAAWRHALGGRFVFVTAEGLVTEHHMRVPRSARYFTLGESAPHPKEIWVACHGYGQLAARFIRQFDHLDDGTRLIAAPEALSRFYLDPVGTRHGPDARVGATWMTREARLEDIRDYVEYLDLVVAELLSTRDRDAVRLVGFGFSQGVATAMRWAALGSTRLDRLILWAGSLPEDLVLADHPGRFDSEPLVYVVGDKDEFLNERAIDRQRGRLRDAGLRHAFVSFNGGHTMDGEELVRVASLAASGR
jgi:predicted esterase